ncbi:MAG: hypothetical protein IPG38_17385 [Chitinophagaceae bacterium]|nr:hypothetical protein [Chitinophagaceae bacterium]
MNLIIQSIQNRLLLQHQNKFQHGFIPLIMSNLKNICFNIFLLSFVFPIKIGQASATLWRNKKSRQERLQPPTGQAVPAE